MKRILKCTLSIFLAVIILLGSVPISRFVGVDLPNFNEIFATKAKAIEASDLPEDFDLVTYNIYANFDEAEGHYGGLFYMLFRDMVKFGSLSQIVYNSFDNSSEFLLTVEAWESIRMISDPSSVAEALEFQRQYEEVIFAALFSALSDEKYTEFSYSNALSKATGLTDKILSSSKTAELLDKTSLDGTEKQELIDTAFAFLTNGKDVESKWSALGEYTDIVNKYISIADDIAGGVVSAINIIDSVSMYVSMLDSGAEVIEYLYDLKDKSPNSVFSAAVQTVINTISNDWVGVVGKTIIDVGFVLGMEATDKLIDYAWTGCCAVFPFLTGLYIGGEIGALACNILFGTEDLIEQYEYLKIMTQIEAVSCALYEDYGESCSVYVNSDNAALFTFATRFSYMLYLLGGEAGIEMFNIACNKGIVTKLITGESFDNFEETAIEILDGSKDSYNNVVSCWKKCIEEDYPDFFKTLTEEEIEPKYIESITMDKDEVTFRVGEIMSYSWTIAPLDYEGSLGIKSDNEAVVKSREPMGIQTYALEENIGTANVTIYSIDNPEICDTIKITVIGEDEEGTTEADNKYVTGKCGDNLTWSINKNTSRLTINGVGAMKDYSQKKAPWYSYRSYVKSVTIGNSITTIGESAFYYCKDITSVTIGDKVTTIGKYAFQNCYSLKNVTIGNNITTIKKNAFYDCESIKSVTIGDGVKTIGEDAFYGCSDIKTVYYIGDIDGWCEISFASIYSNPIGFADNFYINGNLIEGELVIPDSITSIGDRAFLCCNSITSVIIGNRVTTIGNYAFENCNNLTSVTIADGVTNIGDCAFNDCESIKSVTIGNSVTNIGDAAFCNCDSLKSVTMGNSVTTISNRAFYNCSSLTNIIIPNSVTTIGKSAFDDCESIKSVTIGDGVKTIGKSAFRGCSNIKTVYYTGDIDGWCEIGFTDGSSNPMCYADNIYIDSKLVEGELVIPDSVTSIGNYAFYNCYNFASVTIGRNVTSIGESAFDSCENLVSVTIPHSITTIGNEAFIYCNSLTNVYYIGTEERWQNISIGLNNEKLTSAIIHYNYAPDVHVHSYTSSVTIVATCTNEGFITYTCPCGDIYTESISVTEHAASGWQIVIEPTTETAGKKIKKCTVCGVTVAEEIIAKLQKKPVKDNSVVKNPSTSSISYGDSIILHVDASKIPEGGYVEWIASNSNFDMDVSSDGTTCTISPSSSGDTTFTATVYDANGNAVSADEQVMTSKAGFFDKIIAFFKKLFGLTKTIPQIYKGIF